VATLTAAQERVLNALRAGPARAQELAKALGVDTSAVRRQLVALAAFGLVEASDTVTGRGRPKRTYHLTDSGKETGPRNYPFLLASLMQKVSAGSGRKQLLRFLQEIAADLGGPASRQQAAKARLDILLLKYNELGFQSSATTKGQDVSLVHRNCPFFAAASADPDALCHHLDKGILEAAYPGATVEVLSTMAEGASSCQFRIHLPKPTR
jgi:predicted ArsR family transcriptional regulator